MVTSYYSGKINLDILNKTQLKLRVHKLTIIGAIKHREYTEYVYLWY